MSYNNRNNDYYEPKPDLEESTPWNQLKDGISQKYQNPEDDEDMLFIDDEERFNIRDRNYKVIVFFSLETKKSSKIHF